MERIKLLYSILADAINIFDLLGENFLFDFTAIHDHWLRAGEDKEYLFEKVIDPEVDFIDDGKLQGVFEQIKDATDDPSDFIKEPLNAKLSARCGQMHHLNIRGIWMYFGEKIALYFNYVCKYTRYTGWVSPIALIVFIIEYVMVGMVWREELKMLMTVFAMFSSIAATLWFETWSRSQKQFALQYGMCGFESRETTRPGFKGTFQKDLATNSYNEKYYPPFKRLVKQTYGWIISLIILLLSCAAAIACLFMKKIMDGVTGMPQMFASAIPSVLNSIQVIIFNNLYRGVAIACTDNENYQTQTKYEDSLILKTFIFQFFNTFNSIFIIAYVKPYLDPEGPVSFGNCVSSFRFRDKNLECYGELQAQVESYFIVGFAMNFLEVLIPAIKQKIAKGREVKEPPRNYSWGRIDKTIMQERFLDKYETTPEVDGTLGDYGELVIQFTYLSLFGMAFPISYLISYFTNLCEIHLDMYHLINQSRRPIPKGCEDIGSFHSILQVVAFQSIFFNAATVTFTLRAFEGIYGHNSWGVRLGTFLGFIAICIVFKGFVMFCVVDNPYGYMKIRARHYFQMTNAKGGKNLCGILRAGVPINYPTCLSKLNDDSKCDLEFDVKGNIKVVDKSSISRSKFSRGDVDPLKSKGGSINMIKSGIGKKSNSNKSSKQSQNSPNAEVKLLNIKNTEKRLSQQIIDPNEQQEFMNKMNQFDDKNNMKNFRGDFEKGHQEALKKESVDYGNDSQNQMIGLDSQLNNVENSNQLNKGESHDYGAYYSGVHSNNPTLKDDGTANKKPGNERYQNL